MLNNRIAIFLGGYLPAKKYGGPVTSIVNLVDNLSDKWEFFIISNDHDLDDPRRLPGIRDGWNTVGMAKVLYIKEIQYQEKYFKQILQEVKPALVYLSSVFYYQMNFPALRAAKSLSIPTVLAPRGEICQGALSMKSFKKKLFLAYTKCIGIFRNVYFQATSAEEEEALQRILKVENSHIVLLPNMPCAIKPLGTCEKTKGELHCVFISRIVSNKNLLFAIQAVKQCAAEIFFDIYGPIEEPGYWDLCQKEAACSPSHIHITYKGTLNPGESSGVFAGSHCFVFPTLTENYGHVIAEAITSGCPVVVGRGNTPWDDIHGHGGFSIPLENPSEWTETIDRVAEMDREAFHLMQDMLSVYTEEKLKPTRLKQHYHDFFANVSKEMMQ